MLSMENTTETLYTGYTLLLASKENAIHEGNGENTFLKSHGYVH